MAVEHHWGTWKLLVIRQQFKSDYRSKNLEYSHMLATIKIFMYNRIVPKMVVTKTDNCACMYEFLVLAICDT